MSGIVVWFTGKPSSGKSTLARAIAAALKENGTSVCLLDGDEVRSAIVPKGGYDPKSRDEFYATLGNLAALLARQGLVVLVPATAYLRAFRDRARAAAPAFIEVYVNASQEEILARDSKGLYRAVREGRISGVPGADLAFEESADAEFVARGGRDEQTEAAVVAAVQAALASS